MSLQDSRLRADTRHPSTPAVKRVGGLVPGAVVLVALVAAASRLPFVGSPATSDEAGFLEVARHWHPGSSLYGPYWVDRPPLLIALFRTGDALGGLTGLRVLGIFVVLLTVVGVGVGLNRVGGRRAATYGAVVAGALLANPAAGALDVNGELLAAPFVAWGFAGLMFALTTESFARAAWAASAAGASAAAALLVKQNMIDVFVLALPLGVLAVRAGVVDRRRGLRLLLFLGLGAAAGLVVVLGLAAVRGTSPTGVGFAMYPFRVQAAAVMGHVSLAVRLDRLAHLGLIWLVTGAPLMLLALAALMVRRPGRAGRAGRRGTPLQRALGASVGLLLVYDAGSIAAGGSYWLHYLVQLVVPTALAAGLAVALVAPVRGTVARRAPAMLLPLLCVLLCSGGWAGGLVHRSEAGGTLVGRSLGAVSQPGDSVVSLLGSADIVQASGLSSPYRYLWSLPAHTLDPRMRRLSSLLSGPAAPTWLVVRGPATTAFLRHSAAGPAFDADYLRVGRVCGRRIYLRENLTRSTPAPASGCRLPLSTWFRPDPTKETHR